MQPPIYEVCDPQSLNNIINCLYSCLDLPVCLLDQSGNTLYSTGSRPAFCDTYKNLLSLNQLPGEDCCEQYLRASTHAMNQGSSYVFSCLANLDYVIYPFIDQDTLIGAVLVGPFLMERPDSTMMLEIAQRNSLSTEHILELYEAADSVPVIPSSKATQISYLLPHIFDPLIPTGSLHRQQCQNKAIQQRHISESIQKYKQNPLSETNSYPYEKEKMLIRKVKERNVQEARSVLNELLGHVLFDSGSNLDIIRSRAMELCSVLSRAAMESGTNPDVALKISNSFLQELSASRTQEDLCLQLQKTVEYFIDSMFIKGSDKNSKAIKAALLYVNENYASALTLEETANQARLNPSYFSTLFKQSCGMSFKEYLNYIRVEESKTMLSSTGAQILDIAISAGFEDQSYFTKVFKKFTGMTPKQFRNQQNS